MTDYAHVASYDVRKVLLTELQANNLYDPNNYRADGFYEALEPIIPAQQVPEFNNLLPGKTYIIYDIMQKHTGVQWWMSEEANTFDIVSRDQTEIQTLLNFITDLFRRYDLAARDVNISLASGSPYTYHYFRLESADTIQSFQNEGGFMSAIITIHYAYTREVNSNTGRYL